MKADEVKRLAERVSTFDYAPTLAPILGINDAADLLALLRALASGKLVVCDAEPVGWVNESGHMIPSTYKSALITAGEQEYADRFSVALYTQDTSHD